MTKGIGLIMFQEATFSTGCVLLNFPGHFLLCFSLQRNANSSVNFEADEIRRFSASAFYFILSSPLLEASSFHVPEEFICSGTGSLQALWQGLYVCFLILFASLLLFFLLQCGKESRSVSLSLWALGSIFHMHYELVVIKLQVCYDSPCFNM